MSADNWTICPNCKVIHERKNEQARDNVKSQYGKVSEDEYVKMLNAIPEAIETAGNTLREDYEMGMDGGGEFSVSYRCSCSECGFSFSFDNVSNPEIKGKKTK